MTDRLTPGQLRDLADLTANPYQARKFNQEAARREAEAPTRTDAMRQIAQKYGFGSRTPTLDALDLTKKPDAPPPPAPFVTDHKWLDPECHASGCQTLILKAEVEKLKDQRDKYMWQVRDTCARAEAAEARVRELEATLNADDRDRKASPLNVTGTMTVRYVERDPLAGGNDG